jgi:excisionase family DNA binding protein
MTTKYVNTAELAEYFGVANATVLAMMRSGEIPSGTYVRIGRVFRFDLRLIEEHLLTTSNESEGHGRLPDGDAEAKPTQLEFDFDAATTENFND